MRIFELTESERDHLNNIGEAYSLKIEEMEEIINNPNSTNRAVERAKRRLRNLRSDYQTDMNEESLRILKSLYERLGDDRKKKVICEAREILDEVILSEYERYNSKNNKPKRIPPEKLVSSISSKLSAHICIMKEYSEYDELASLINEIINDSKLIVHHRGHRFDWKEASEEHNIDTSVKYLKLYHLIPADAIAKIDQNDFVRNESQALTAFWKEIQVTYTESNGDQNGIININTHKLLQVASAEFLKNNANREKGQGVVYDVKIPLKEFAIMLGYDGIKENETNTPEEQKAERRRALDAYRKARGRIDKYAMGLYHTSLDWYDPCETGEMQKHAHVRILQAAVVGDDDIYMTFSIPWADYMMSSPITAYPTALLGIDTRNSYAYHIGLKLSQHYNIPNNKRKKTNNILRVSSILADTDFSIEKIRSNRQSWISHIKEPFENALELLVREGVLLNYEYTKEKGMRLTDEENLAIETYEEFAKLYLRFEMAPKTDNV